MLNTGTNSLDDMLSKGKAVGNCFGLGYSNFVGQYNSHSQSKGKQKIKSFLAEKAESYDNAITVGFMS